MERRVKFKEGVAEKWGCPVLGDEVMERFWDWVRYLRDHEENAEAEKALGDTAVSGAAYGVPLFVQWLTSTADGEAALRRINAFPRQRALPFEEEKTWSLE